VFFQFEYQTQIATYGIYAQRDMGHLDIDDNFFKRAPDDVLVHRYKGDKQPVNLINRGHLYLDGKYFERLSLGYF
jgi:hypothetical protein